MHIGCHKAILFPFNRWAQVVDYPPRCLHHRINLIFLYPSFDRYVYYSPGDFYFCLNCRHDVMRVFFWYLVICHLNSSHSRAVTMMHCVDYLYIIGLVDCSTYFRFNIQFRWLGIFCLCTIFSWYEQYRDKNVVISMLLPWRSFFFLEAFRFSNIYLRTIQVSNINIRKYFHRIRNLTYFCCQMMWLLHVIVKYFHSEIRISHSQFYNETILIMIGMQVI